MILKKMRKKIKKLKMKKSKNDIRNYLIIKYICIIFYYLKNISKIKVKKIYFIYYFNNIILNLNLIYILSLII